MNPLITSWFTKARHGDEVASSPVTTRHFGDDIPQNFGHFGDDILYGLTHTYLIST